MTVVTLPQVPGLGGLYLRGAVRRGSGARLPDVSYRASDVRADPARLTAYQHLFREAGTDQLPAGFVHTLAFPVATALMARPDFPLRLLGMVHLANRATQHRPLLLGEPLTVEATARDLRPHHRGTQVDLLTTVSGADGDEAWRGVSTYLAPGVHLPGAERPERGERPDFQPPLPTGRWRYDAGRGRRYAAISGDANPIHLSALSAKAFGFPRAIAHGMDTAARALSDVGAARGERFTWTVEFAAPVLLPSSPSVRVARDGDGFGYTVWDARRNKLHLHGRVDPAPSG
ncbi:MaoC/PaaZ C-terminal domain-containing protein [Cellulomonas sp. NPDC089187]|uniref:MaoC/PaaZ C-terminal domain-containing protein n=1 Tax=Cellulomonas sp. NPDC089187 TaxID=3154970 RepID=UPI003445F4C9